MCRRMVQRKECKSIYCLLVDKREGDKICRTKIVRNCLIVRFVGVQTLDMTDIGVVISTDFTLDV